MRRERVVACTAFGCKETAVFKIAAPWSDDCHRGLKTYEFACEVHVRSLFEEAEIRWMEYEPGPEETVEDLGVFRLDPSKGDRDLERDLDMEAILRP